ncbi:MAG: peptidoglycan-binding protein [Actinobacteria bacterium]|nr:peptidoglycan-binding protein [Actinomycetota bacterium]
MNSGPTIQAGAKGDAVRRLQRILVMIKLLGYEGIDGDFGPKTTAAVKSFQESSGIGVDGIAGADTWSALPPDPGTVLLAQGSTGPKVSALQGALRKYKGPGTPTDPGLVDGDFGPKTRSAVVAYQGERGVTADGKVGDRTWWVPAGGAGATLASLAGLTTV